MLVNTKTWGEGLFNEGMFIEGNKNRCKALYLFLLPSIKVVK